MAGQYLKKAMTASIEIFFNSSFMYYATIWHYIIYNIERVIKKPAIKENHSHLTNSGSMEYMCIFMYVWLWKEKWFLKCYSFISVWYTWSPRKTLLHICTLSQFLLWIVL
jgi:hypothetical protein